MKHHILRALIILVFLFSASYSYAAISYDLKISVYDAVKSQILQSLADDPSYSFLEDQHFQAISHICNDIPGRRDSETTNQYFNRNRYYSPALGRFTSKDPIGFNGGMNLYRYADNNPVLFTDPFGLYSCKYKDLVVRVLNYYDTTPFFYGKAILNTAFNFFKTTEDGPEIRVYDFKMPGQKDLLGTVGTWPWTSRTEKVLSDFSLPHNADEFVANIVIANTNWRTTAGGSIAGRTDQDGKNQALVSGKYYAHLDPIKLGWTITHETGHILLGRKADNSYTVKYTVGPAIMTPGSWDSTEFLESNRKKILDALAKTTKP